MTGYIGFVLFILALDTAICLIELATQSFLPRGAGGVALEVAFNTIMLAVGLAVLAKESHK